MGSEVRYFELNMYQFMDYSPAPLTVRMRLALGKLGMKFEDDGKFGLVTNENPVPLGTAWCWEEADKPGVRMYAQRITEGRDDQQVSVPDLWARMARMETGLVRHAQVRTVWEI